MTKEQRRSTWERGAPLVLGDDGGGPRHFLAGARVPAGTVLHMRIAWESAPGREALWVVGRYEWSFERDDPPMFHFSVATGSDQESGDEVVCRITPLALLRWPIP